VARPRRTGTESGELTPEELAEANARRFTPGELAAAEARAEGLPVVERLEDLPAFPAGPAGDAAFARFWDTHAAGPGPAARRPAREAGTPISIRLEADTVRRLRALAAKKGTKYQTLLKAFVQERLYEEEKREGLVGTSPAPAALDGGGA
jgi:hypothetical protein